MSYNFSKMLQVDDITQMLLLWLFKFNHKMTSFV